VTELTDFDRLKLFGTVRHSVHSKTLKMVKIAHSEPFELFGLYVTSEMVQNVTYGYLRVQNKLFDLFGTVRHRNGSE
jgi:hypothetical protein